MWDKAAAMAGNSPLTRFAAWYCNIGRQGGIAIAHCLETNTTLTHLGLVNNTIEDAGAEVFGDTLGSKQEVAKLSTQEGAAVVLWDGHALQARRRWI